MSVQQIDSKLLSRMFLSGAANLENNKEIINELNVFPVPDGDTGTNMTMTIMSAAKEVRELGEDVAMLPLCKAISSGSLRGARGNSGVILSQLLRGFTKIARDEEVITIPVMVTAFSKAVETAYKAVMKPKEGTILTVARGMSEKANDLSEDGCEDLETFMTEILNQGQTVLEHTPELLPVLKEAGVVDSGGQGLICFLQGAVACYQGKEIISSVETVPAQEPEAEEINNLYCVELNIKLDKVFNAKNELDLTNYLQSIGESVVVVTNEGLACVHIHTNDPGLVIQKCLKYGELCRVKVINRRSEKEEADNTAVEKPASAESTEANDKPSFNEPAKPYGFITVAAGKGLTEIFTSLGVDYVIEGGQTMNPSTADFLDAVEKVNAETIFVLPNNKNIILAANQAAELVTDKTVLVIPTKTVPQGITAVINFVPELSADENEQAMLDEIKNVKTGQITYSVRDTSIDGKAIHKDDFMGLSDSGLAAVGLDKNTVVKETIESMLDDDSELISIYYGDEVTEDEAQALAGELSAAFKDKDIELQYGGQPVYYYMISVE